MATQTQPHPRQRRTAMPFPTLDACCVLDTKAVAEQGLIEAADQKGFLYTIVQPEQLSSKIFLLDMIPVNSRPDITSAFPLTDSSLISFMGCFYLGYKNDARMIFLSWYKFRDRTSPWSQIFLPCWKLWNLDTVRNLLGSRAMDGPPRLSLVSTWTQWNKTLD